MKRTLPVMWALLLALIVGCERRELPPPKPVTALERPVLRLAVGIGEHQKLLVPRAALVARAGVIGVFVLNQTGEARFRIVKSGRVRGAEVEILSGLNGNEMLVLGDLTSVHDGTPVRKK